ncbi:MAG: lamin tail domain-containing protein, partial [Bacteroidetes bacterium]|nr:lamin tail domain-containing protein [Bacteroidota bacterium]
MKRNLIRAVCLAAALTNVFNGTAQVHDDFSDGDFSNNPVWTGNASDWIVNTAQRLQSNNTTANSSFYISTANQLAAGAQWELSIQLQFNTSSNNYVDIWLTASAADVSKNSTTGYFVRLGNTDDDICLYRRDTGGIATRLIDGLDGTLNSSNNNLKLKVVCDATHHWSLYRDPGLTGNYILEGNATDSTYTSSSFFAILVKQSTAGFFQKHFFDDIDISSYIPDTTPPTLLGAAATDTSALDVLFSEAVDPTTAQAAGNYFADNGIGFPVSVKQDAANRSLVHLVFGHRFPNGTQCRLSVNQVKDLAGNAMPAAGTTFSYYTVQTFDVLIDEIMADPNPTVGLPPYEYIELKNVSTHLLDLYGWQVCDSTACATINTHVLLPPDSFLIVTSGSAAGSMTGYGATLGAGSFPTLNNEGDLLYLRSHEGRMIHAVAYNTGWYHNDIKSKGGWSLEMIDTQLPCTGITNWRASMAAEGGTPGRKNSVQAVNNDTEPPVLLRATALDSNSILLSFDEPLDSTQASIPLHYSVDKGIGPVATARVQYPLFDKVLLTTVHPLSPGIVYTITVNGITDCPGNTIAGFNTARTGLASTPDSLDVVI